MQKETMNIIFSINNNYCEKLAVTLFSLISSNRNNKLNIYIVNSNISDLNKSKLKEFEKNNKITINFVNTNHEMFENLPTLNRLDSLTYTKIILASLINVNKALYLDCDILITKNIEEYYNQNIEDVYASVVEDELSESFHLINQMKKLNIKKYFNAGVILFNLKKIREDDIEKKCFDFINKRPQDIIYMDQCVLNYAINNKIKYTDRIYNYQYRLKVAEKNKNACIIHFVGKEKPYCGYNHPYENLYYKFLKQTPYKKNYLKFKKEMLEMYINRIKNKIKVIINCLAY